MGFGQKLLFNPNFINTFTVVLFGLLYFIGANLTRILCHDQNNSKIISFCNSVRYHKIAKWLEIISSFALTYIICCLIIYLKETLIDIKLYRSRERI